MTYETSPTWSRNAVRAPAIDDVLHYDWGNIKVGHIDTGVRNHPALGHWIRVSDGYNFVTNKPDPSPLPPQGDIIYQPGHGTSTCSVLAGYETNAEGGVRFAGVAPKLPVIPFCVSDNVLLSGPDHQARVGNAIDMAVEKGCKVITISLGFPVISKDSALGKAVDKAYEKGVIICAAGGQVYGATCYPGKFFRTIGVGGFMGYANGKRPIYFAYRELNAFVDAWAPANPVFRADGAENSRAYGWGDGTSYATPHVAAAAAYWLRHHQVGAHDQYDIEPWRWVEAFRLLLRQLSDDLSYQPGFSQIRPAGANGVPPKKGNDDGESSTSGGLDIPALLDAPLPPVDALHKATLAVRQWL